MLRRSSPRFLRWEVILPTTVCSGAFKSWCGNNVDPTRKTCCIRKWFHPIGRINADNISLKPVNVFNKMSGAFPAAFVATKLDIFNKKFQSCLWWQNRIEYADEDANYLMRRHNFHSCWWRQMSGHFPAVCGNKTRYFWWDVWSQNLDIFSGTQGQFRAVLAGNKMGNFWQDIRQCFSWITGCFY